jgi:hypothetical protein
MVEEYVHNNPRDSTEERCEQLESQVVDISRNMKLLMASLASNIRPFRDHGGSNSENSSEGKSEDYEENESQK